MYSSDPRPDTGSLMQLESRRAVPNRLHSPHNPKPQPGHFKNSTTRRPRSEKPLQTSGSRTFLSFSCFSIANQEAVSRSAALLLRIKALALQKGPLFVLFALMERTAAILDVAVLCAVKGAQCKTRELPEETRPSIFAQSDHLKPKLSLCCLFAIKRERLSPLFICVFYPLWPHKKIYLKEKKIWIIEVVIF